VFVVFRGFPVAVLCRVNKDNELRRSNPRSYKDVCPKGKHEAGFVVFVGMNDLRVEQGE
jgi:hypothetical protein